MLPVAVLFAFRYIAANHEIDVIAITTTKLILPGIFTGIMAVPRFWRKY